jgi:LL-diaminopimelate aminotransferase
MNQKPFSKKQSSPELSKLVTTALGGLSPIQTIMKMAEPNHIIELGLDPSTVISFGGGWCNHSAPESLRNIYQQIASDKKSFHKSGRYSPIVGNSFCREQLAQFEQKIYHVHSIQDQNIILGHSSTQLFHDLLRVLANPADTLCLLDPTYANYENAIRASLPTSKIQFISALNPETWTYLTEPEKSLEQLKQHCSQGAKALIIPVPDNPTSQIPSDSFLQSALQILEDYQGFLVIDHAYKSLYFDTMPHCFTWSPQDYPNLVTIHSNSKWLSSLGRRLGWVEASQSIIQGLEKINESTLLSPDTLHSYATALFLEKTLSDGSLKTYIDRTRHLYKKTSQVLIDSIQTKLDWDFLQPAGGLYTCCRTPNNEDPMTFIQRILKNTGVLLIPGTGFGPSMNKAIRLSYGPLCNDFESIEQGIKRIATYLQDN